MGFEFDPRQRVAAEKLKNGSILCGGVGSGKSRTSLYYYYVRLCGGKIDAESRESMKLPYDIYIITTARKRDTHEWEDELVPFGIAEDERVKVTIDSWNNVKKYVSVKGAFFIFDEQRVVGYGAWVHAFLAIAKTNRWVLLSATPGDNWMDYIPVFIANGFYKNKTEFITRHVIYSRYSKFPRVDRYLDQAHLNRLRNSILVNIEQEKKTVAHDIYIPAVYDRVLYKSVMSTRKNLFTGKPIRNVSELSVTLRRIVNSDESRQEAVLELCKEHPKAIIFYNYNFELDILRSLSYEAGTEVAEWNGTNHEPIPKSDRWVYLVQYTAGAEGWNCIETDTIIFYSLNYSYKTMAQAAGRIDRRNTPFTDLWYYRLRSSAPIDLGISRALRNKKNFNETGFFST